MSSESKSPGWVKEGAFWAYHKPPSAAQQLLMENARKSQEERARWRKRLGEEAFHCPDCGSGDYFEWLIGWWPDDDHYHDPNRKECSNCGRWWWVVCPTCGHNEGRTKESYFDDCRRRDKEKKEKDYGRISTPRSEK